MTAPTSPAPRRTLIIGGGLAGAAAATALRDRGLAPLVLDKGRGPGGRASTRRPPPCPFDHGAQYFTVRDDRFAERVARLVAEGAVAPWDARFAIARNGELEPHTPSHSRYVGVPGMNRLVAQLLDPLETRFGVRVDALRRHDGAWHAHTEHGENLGPFDHAIIALPAPQAALLLADAAPDLAAQTRAVRFAPCWAVMISFDRPLDVPFDALTVETTDDGALAWAGRNSSKPGRPRVPDAWTLHASAAWSQTNIELAPEEAGPALVRSFLELLALHLGAAPHPSHLAAHRWRYARAESPLDAGCLHDRDARLTICGDWCLGDRIEAAYCSGLAAARAVLDINT